MLESRCCTVSETLSGLFVLLHLLPRWQPTNQTRPRSAQSQSCKMSNYLHTDEIIQTSFLFVHDGMNILNMIAWQRAFKVGDGLVMISSTATRGNSEKCSSLLQWLQERAISGPRSHLGLKIFTEVVSADIKEEICQLAGSNNILIALSKTLLNRCRVNIKVKYEHEKRLPCHWSCMVVNFSNNTQCIAMPR